MNLDCQNSEFIMSKYTYSVNVLYSACTIFGIEFYVI